MSRPLRSNFPRGSYLWAVRNAQWQVLGIPEEDMKHLFERFFRGKNVLNIPGTGLGLHIVSKYIELMDGTISVASEIEKGTIFTIKFNL